jgi:hypothetical protein
MGAPKPGAHKARPYVGSRIFVGAWLVHALRYSYSFT